MPTADRYARWAAADRRQLPHTQVALRAALAERDRARDVAVALEAENAYLTEQLTDALTRETLTAMWARDQADLGALA